MCELSCSCSNDITSCCDDVSTLGDEVSTHNDDLSARSKTFLPTQGLDISLHECNV